MILEGKNVLLRPIEMKDTELIVKWRNNPKVLNNFIFREKLTTDIHKNWMNTKWRQGSCSIYN